MLEYIKQEANRTFTENGAVTQITSGSDCLDLFATAGALRSASADEITRRFAGAYREDPGLAMKILFFARDVRGGLGERRFFRVCLDWLARNAPASLRKNIPHIPWFGRWDDLLCLLDTPCQADALALIQTQLRADLEAMDMGDEVSLLAKWLPSVNASSALAVRQARLIARRLGMTDEQYRKTLVQLRNRIRILENNLRTKDYTFDYAKQPSKALFKYRKAFRRNDGERYGAYLDGVARGEAVLHTGTLAPYEIIRPLLDRNPDPAELQTLDTTWNAQADFTGGENALVVIDGSGSMYCGGDPLPAAVALSLGIYFAERNTGAFQNHFITFSQNPRLVEIRGGTLREKVAHCRKYNEVANTNLRRVFDLILRTAVKNRVPQEQMPATLYIISDMEFDACAGDADLTNFEYAKQCFAEAGYALPRVVFWNVQSRNQQQPVTMNEQGVALVSGCSPRIFSMLKSGCMTPMAYMLDILGTERYAVITA